MLVDTDVLIWHLRGYPQATQKLDSQVGWARFCAHADTKPRG